MPPHPPAATRSYSRTAAFRDERRDQRAGGSRVGPTFTLRPRSVHAASSSAVPYERVSTVARASSLTAKSPHPLHHPPRRSAHQSCPPWQRCRWPPSRGSPRPRRDAPVPVAPRLSSAAPPRATPPSSPPVSSPSPPPTPRGPTRHPKHPKPPRPKPPLRPPTRSPTPPLRPPPRPMPPPRRLRMLPRKLLMPPPRLRRRHPRRSTARSAA